MKNRSTAEKKNRLFTIVKAIVLLLILVGLPVYLLVFHRDVFTGARSLDDVVQLLRQYPGRSAFIYILLQILQIVVSILPGQVFQIAAGVVFGVPVGILLSVIGAVLGTAVTYLCARFLGTDAMALMLGEEKTAKFIQILNSEKAYILVFLIYLIPGMPKDLFAYAAGISQMRFRPFLILSTAGRVPAMCLSLLFGWLYTKKFYTAMIVMGSLIAAFLLVLFIFRKKLSKLVDRIYQRLTDH